MNKLNLTEEEENQLKKIHKYTYNNSMRENRIKVILLINKEVNRKEIKEILLLDLQTIRRYINDFIQYGINSIDIDDKRKDNSGNKKKITPKQEKEVKKFVEDNLVEDSKEIQKYIKDKFNITYKESTIVKLLHDLGFVYKKVVTIPQKANSIETNSGRDRVNLNGDYNINTGELIATPSETINSNSTIKLFDTILENYNNSSANIYLFADNARYYKSKMIQEALQTDKYKRIKMIFLPAYLPNLNPIERVWKFFKKEVLENKFYKTFHIFKSAIDDFFNEELKLPLLQEKLKRFASDNFHIRHRKLCYLPLEYQEFKLNYFGR